MATTCTAAPLAFSGSMRLGEALASRSRTRPPGGAVNGNGAEPALTRSADASAPEKIDDGVEIGRGRRGLVDHDRAEQIEARRHRARKDKSRALPENRRSRAIRAEPASSRRARETPAQARPVQRGRLSERVDEAQTEPASRRDAQQRARRGAVVAVRPRLQRDGGVGALARAVPEPAQNAPPRTARRLGCAILAHI